MSSRAIEQHLCTLISETNATPQKVEDMHARLSCNLKNKGVGSVVLNAAIKTRRPEMAQVVINVGLEKDISSTEMCLAFAYEAPDTVLQVLDSVLKKSKIPMLMNQLIDRSYSSPYALLEFRRAYERYGILPTASCWRTVNELPDAWYNAWHAELSEKVKPTRLDDSQITRVVCNLKEGDTWKDRLTDLEEKGFKLDLDTLRRLVSGNVLAHVESFRKFVTQRGRKAGAVKAAITKKSRSSGCRPPSLEIGNPRRQRRLPAPSSSALRSS